MAGETTTLFGVGATKAGTSWLYRYLHAHPDCHLRSVKELHCFDARDRDDCEWQAGRFQRRQREAEAAGDMVRVDDYDLLIGLQETDENPTAYLHYLNDGRGEKKLVADITPSYSLLSADRFRAMGRMAADVRFIYILRDPVARFWSHVRMKAKRRAGDTGSIEESANRIFWRTERGRNAGILKRGNYRDVLENLRGAINPSRLLVLFYEDLFTAATVNRICDFLGIRRHPADFSRAVNSGAVLAMSDKQQSLARNWLAEQYDYVSAHFDNVPDAWMTDKMRVRA
jgi:hypothetical protein